MILIAEADGPTQADNLDNILQRLSQEDEDINNNIHLTRTSRNKNPIQRSDLNLAKEQIIFDTQRNLHNHDRFR